MEEKGKGETHKRSGETEDTDTHRCREVTYFIKRSSYPRQADRGWRRGGGGGRGGGTKETAKKVDKNDRICRGQRGEPELPEHMVSGCNMGGKMYFYSINAAKMSFFQPHPLPSTFDLSSSSALFCLSSHADHRRFFDSSCHRPPSVTNDRRSTRSCIFAFCAVPPDPHCLFILPFILSPVQTSSSTCLPCSN